MNEGNQACVRLREILTQWPRIDALKALSDEAIARGDRKITIEYDDITVLREHDADCPETPTRQEISDPTTYIVELKLGDRTFVYCSSMPFKIPFPVPELVS